MITNGFQSAIRIEYQDGFSWKSYDKTSASKTYYIQGLDAFKDCDSEIISRAAITF